MLISIIIPIYNKEAVIRRTIDSVLAQNLDKEEFELILIDDGSTDDSLLVCKAFKETHQDIIIEVIHKENEGVAKARNTGLSIAKGNYVYFMDADDYLMPNGLNYLTSHFLSNELDILVFSSTTIPNFNPQDIPIGSTTGSVIYEGSGCKYLKEHWLFSVCMQIIKKSFIVSNQLQFQDLKIAEDILFNLHAWSKDPKVRITSCNIYRYINYSNKNQLTKNRDSEFLKKSIESYKKLFEEIAFLNCFFKQEYDSNNMENIFKSLLRPFMSRILSSNISTKEFNNIMERLECLQLLPLKKPVNKVTKVFILIKNSYLFLPIYQVLYKSIVVPHIIPRIDRETGKFHFKVGSQRNTF